MQVLYSDVGYVESIKFVPFVLIFTYFSHCVIIHKERDSKVR
jgi:hypothetical protein